MARYEITERPTDHGTACRLSDTERRAEALLYPELGNNCTEFRTTPAPDGSGEPIDIFVPPDDLDVLRAASPFSAGQPLLFPFPNRVRDGVFTFEGRTVKMEKLLATGWDKGAGQAIHGLVADKPWTVEEANAGADGATVRSSLQLDSFPDIFEQYPFPCRIRVTYTLREGVLHMRTEVANTGSGNLPMGFGIHPWFPAALRPGLRLPEGLEQITEEQRAQAQVRIPAAALWELKNLMPTGVKISVENEAQEYDLRAYRPLRGQFFDNVFTRVQRGVDGWSEAGVRDPETGLEMFIAADGQFREWVLYAPLTRRVVAIEPYTCVTDAVNLEPQGVDAGLIVLPAGETWTGDIRFGLRRF